MLCQGRRLLRSRGDQEQRLNPMHASRNAPTPPTAPFTVSELRRDVGCSGNLNWRCELPPNPDPGDIEKRITNGVWTSRCSHPTFRVFRHPDGHEIAWVLSTGRIQIRVSIAVEKRRRKEVATEIYRNLTEYLASNRSDNAIEGSSPPSLPDPGSNAQLQVPTS